MSRRDGGSAWTGVLQLVRFTLRRERRALPIWLLVTSGLVVVQSTQSQALYGSPEALADLRRTMAGNAAIVAMSGPEELLATIGGEVVFEIFAFAAIVVGLMNMFLVGRNTRADEESGRAELLRSARVSRPAAPLAALTVAAAADVVLAVLVAAGAAGTGLPLAGSVLFGAALGAVGLVVAAATALAAQVFENTRGVYGAATGVIGLAYALRAAGDAGSPVLSWLSPIGWGQRTLPFVEDRWWVLAVPLAAAAALVAAALVMLTRRDFGAGIVPSRPGRATAVAGLGTPLGLAWRLHRMSLLAWTFGAFVLGVMYGSVGQSIEEWVGDNPDIARYLPGGADRIVDSFLAVTLAVSSLLAVGYGVAATLRARSEETSGRAEPVLATAVSRPAWLGSHALVAVAGSALVLLAAALGIGGTYGLSVSDAGQVPRVLGAALAYLPATWVVVAVAVLGIGLVPRAAAPVAWALLAYTALVTLLGDSLDLPGWATSLSPLDHTPQAPLEDVTAVPLVVLLALVAAACAAGLVGFRRRDVATG